MKFKYHIILLMLFLIPNLSISTMMFIREGWPPTNQLAGFYITMFSAVFTYYAGIYFALKDKK